MIFFNEKKIEKDSDNFWYRKLTLKIKRLGDFALFDSYPLNQFSKFDNFLWVCWFLGKDLSNFVPPVWKLHYQYCHNVKRWFCSRTLKFLLGNVQYLLNMLLMKWKRNKSSQLHCVTYLRTNTHSLWVSKELNVQVWPSGRICNDSTFSRLRNDH